MIFHDTVTTVERVKVGVDDLNNDVYEDVETPARAEVRPLTTVDGSDPAATQTVTRYRVFMGPRYTELKTTSGVKWRGRTYEVEGEVEPHLNHGRVHHVEFVMRRVVG